MLYRRLAEGLEVSVVALGGWAFAGDATWGPQEERDSLAAIEAALECGINFFDTAEAYGDGRSEEILGRALKSRRDEVVIATKVSPANLSKTRLLESCQKSLERLQTDYIDLYQIHWPNRDVPFAETAEALVQLREEGKIRAVGVSNFGKLDLDELGRMVPVVSDQLPYSLLWRAIEFEILPYCRERGIGVLAYSPLLHGLLTGKFRSADEVPPGRARTRHFSKHRPLTRHGEDGCEDLTFRTIASIREICERYGVPMASAALAWVLAQEGVVSVVVGARNPGQVRENVQAAELRLPEGLLEGLSQTTEELKHALGRNPDMWQSESRFR